LPEWLQWLKDQPPAVVYAVLGITASLEYLIPPLPGDLVILVGVFLVVQSGLALTPAFISMWVGAIVGGYLAYLAGRYLASKPSVTGLRFLDRPRIRQSINQAQQLMIRRGAVLLIINRFLPGIRGALFLGAGLSSLPAWKVIVYGAISSVVWNALLFWAGYSVGKKWHALVGLFQKYQSIAWIVVAIIAVAGFWMLRRLDVREKVVARLSQRPPS